MSAAKKIIGYGSEFEIGDQVLIDGDVSLHGTVTAITFRVKGYVSIEISYLHHGDAKTATVEEFRVSKVKP